MIRLIRGQCVIREHYDAGFEEYKHIIIPGVNFTPDDKNAIARRRTWHRGTVLRLGPPAQTKGGAEVALGFKEGDTVIFHYVHHEKSFTRPWTDGEDAVWVPQHAVDAVVES